MHKIEGKIPTLLQQNKQMGHREWLPIFKRQKKMYAFLLTSKNAPRFHFET